MAVSPAAGPETLSAERLMRGMIKPPMAPATSPDRSGTPEASAMPRHSGTATRNTTIPDGMSYFACASRDPVASGVAAGVGGVISGEAISALVGVMLVLNRIQTQGHVTQCVATVLSRTETLTTLSSMTAGNRPKTGRNRSDLAEFGARPQSDTVPECGAGDLDLAVSPLRR